MAGISKQDIESLRRSGQFNEKWYLEQYPDVSALGMDPAEHYLWIGRRLGRKPSSSFNSTSSSGFNNGAQAEPSATIPPRRNRRPDGKKRIAVFASYSSVGVIEPYVTAYLNGLAEVSDHIIFVTDNDLLEAESASLPDFVSHSIIGRHGEYDFGSYKRGIRYARKTGLLETADELILCNDSCYGPVGSFSALFDSMSSKEYDFWGLTSSTQFQPHIQSYFVLFKKDVIRRKEFLEFFESVKVEKSVEDVVKNYEVKMSRFMENLGFKWGCYIDRQTPGHDIVSSEGPNLTLRPRFLLSSGCPLVKVTPGFHRLPWKTQRSPTLQPSTSGPTASTIPAASRPSTCG